MLRTTLMLNLTQGWHANRSPVLTPSSPCHPPLPQAAACRCTTRCTPKCARCGSGWRRSGRRCWRGESGGACSAYQVLGNSSGRVAGAVSEGAVVAVMSLERTFGIGECVEQQRQALLAR